MREKKKEGRERKTVRRKRYSFGHLEWKGIR